MPHGRVGREATRQRVALDDDGHAPYARRMPRSTATHDDTRDEGTAEPADDLLMAFCRGMADPVFALDDARRVLAANSAALGLFGLTESDVLSRTLVEIIGVTAEGEGHFRARAADGRPIDVRVERVQVDPVALARASEVVVVRRADADGRVTRVPEHVTASLPRRQAEVLTGLVAGHSEKEIAQHLGLSPHTVHDHVKALYRRFQASGRADLVARALTLTERAIR